MPFNFDLSGRKELQKRLLESDLAKAEMEKEVLKRKLYPEEERARIATASFQGMSNPNASPVAQAAYAASLGETAGTRTIPGTSMTIPAGLGEEAEAQMLDNAIRKATFIQKRANIEPDPDARKLYQDVANAAGKSIVAKGKELTVADTAFELNAAAFMRFADQLEGAVQKYGNFESMNPEGSAMIRQLPYEMAIAYAKIVDPSSVAREGEVAAAQKYLVPMSRIPIPDAMGLTPDSPLSIKNSTTLAAIRNQKESLRARIEAYERTSGRKIEIPGTAGGDTASPKPSPAATGQPQQSGQSTFQYDPRARRLIGR